MLRLLYYQYRYGWSLSSHIAHLYLLLSTLLITTITSSTHNKTQNYFLISILFLAFKETNMHFLMFFIQTILIHSLLQKYSLQSHQLQKISIQLINPQNIIAFSSYRLVKSTQFSVFHSLRSDTLKYSSKHYSFKLVLISRHQALKKTINYSIVLSIFYQNIARKHELLLTYAFVWNTLQQNHLHLTKASF